jgi:hypothetical protein
VVERREGEPQREPVSRKESTVSDREYTGTESDDRDRDDKGDEPEFEAHWLGDEAGFTGDEAGFTGDEAGFTGDEAGFTGDEAG